MTAILREPVHTHLEADVVADPFGGWTASCSCRVEFRRPDERTARRALGGHLGRMASRLRALREELRVAAQSGALDSVVSESLEVEA